MAGFVGLMGTMFVAIASQDVQELQGNGSFMPGAKLGLTKEQLRNATIVLQVADDLNASPLARLAEMVAALGESNLKVVANHQGSGYCGVFQASPAHIACDNTKSQAWHFLKGGLGFQAGGAIKLAERNGLSPGSIAYMVEGDLSNFSGPVAAARFYDKFQPKAKQIIAAWQQGGRRALMTLDDSAVEGSPKWIIDHIALPLCTTVGVPKTVALNDAMNARHGPTISGGLSDHQGPPDQRWAADISNGQSPTPEMDRCAAVLAARFHIPWTGSGLASFTTSRYKFQLIYRCSGDACGGDHTNHVHIGVSAIAGPPTP